MIRKFNYTNRTKVNRDDLSISIQTVGSKAHFTATINSENLNFPESAKVYIEPYYGPNYLRFDFGTIKDLKQPTSTDISELKQFSDKIYFRIKIVDESQDNGLLLGFADKLPLSDDSDPENRSSILVVNPVQMDSNEIWRLDFESDSEGAPILEVNKSIEGIKELAKTDIRFIALVFPAAIRIILRRIEEEGFEEDGWSSDWIKFTQIVLGIPESPSKESGNDAVSQWIEDCVKAFCLKNRTFENYLKSLS